GRWLAALGKDTVVIFDLESGAELRRWTVHKAGATKIVFAPDGKLLATAAGDGAVTLWDPATGKERRSLKANDAVRALAFARNGATLTAATQTQVRTWSVEQGTLLRSRDLLDKLASPHLPPTGAFFA